jgi:hypothetical protein
MATKKQPAESEPTSAERVKASSERNATEAKAADKANRADRDAAAAFTDARQRALINPESRARPDPEGNIDQRMAALLKDHKEMGAR